VVPVSWTISRSPTLRSTVLPPSAGPTVTVAGEGEALVTAAWGVPGPCWAQPVAASTGWQGSAHRWSF
jgi:hypothetical protein